MRLDLERHKLLKILSVQRKKLETKKLHDEILGTSFDELFQKMRCDDGKLSEITSELFDNKEIGNYNQHNINGLVCDNKGLTSVSNGKYKARYWKDLWNNLLTISQIIVPILALLIALIAVLDSRQSKAQKEELIQMRKELYKLQEMQYFQTKQISNFQYSIKRDSITRIRSK
jgi:hypothetical protein